MPTVTIEIEGLDALLQRFRQGDALARKSVGTALDKSVAVLHKRLSGYTQDYPGQRESAYVRTGTLRRSIIKEVDYQRFKGQVFTSLDYAPAVIGEGMQWAMHQQMGWWTNLTVAREKAPEVKTFFEEAVQTLAKRLAGGSIF